MRTRLMWVGRYGRRVALGALVVAVLTLPGATGAAEPAGAPAVMVAPNPALGTLLTDAQGMTLYTFKRDTPGQSVCEGQCAQKWPPAVVPEDSHPMAPAGVAGTLGQIERKDDTYQLTYDGMPLYRYAGDTKPGDVNGQGLGGVWFVVSAHPSTASTGTAAGKSW